MALVLFSSAPFHSCVGCKRGSWCPCGRSNNSDLCHFLMLKSQRNYDIDVRGRSPCCQFLGGRAGWRSGNPASKSFLFSVPKRRCRGEMLQNVWSLASTSSN